LWGQKFSGIILPIWLITDVTQERIQEPQNFKNIVVSVKIKGSLSQVMQR
jgi:hypothetical protein